METHSGDGSKICGSKWPLLVLFLSIFFPFAAVHQQRFDSDTPMSRLALLQAVLLEHRLPIDTYHVHTYDKAYVSDTNHYYSDKAPGTVAIALPAAAFAHGILRFIGRDPGAPETWLAVSWLTSAGSLAPIAAGGATLFFVWLCRWVSRRAAFVTTLGVWLGGLAWPYSTMLFSHGLVCGAIAVALWAHPGLSPTLFAWQRTWGAVIVGACLGLALASEFTSGLVCVALAAALVPYGWRSVGLAALSSFPFALLVPLYSWATMGTPWTLPYSHQASFPAMEQGIYAIGLPDSETLLELLFKPARGLFFWMPFFLLAIPGFFWLMVRSKRVFWLVTLPSYATLLVISGRVWDWQAGAAIGPRYLAPILPLLGLSAALAVERLPKTGLFLALCSMALIGLATTTNATPTVEIGNPLLQLNIPAIQQGVLSPNVAGLLGLSPLMSLSMLALVGAGLVLVAWRLNVHGRRSVEAHFGGFSPSQSSSFTERRSASGFTLIELLVVLAVLSVLLSLLLPAVIQARNKAAAAACSGNLRQIQMAWQMYVDDHAQALPSNRADYEGGIWRSSPESWIGHHNAVIDGDPTVLMRGKLARTANLPIPSIYQCPADRSLTSDDNLPAQRRLRSYSMSGVFNGRAEEFQVTFKSFHHVDEPASRFVFLDEHEDSIDDGQFLTWPSPDERWVNLPASRHGRTGVLSFADGHVELWRWRWRKSFTGRQSYWKDVENADDLADLRRLQETIPPLPPGWKPASRR